MHITRISLHAQVGFTKGRQYFSTRKSRELSGGPVVKTVTAEGAVQPLVGELRSQKPCTAKKENLYSTILGSQRRKKSFLEEKHAKDSFHNKEWGENE